MYGGSKYKVDDNQIPEGDFEHEPAMLFVLLTLLSILPFSSCSTLERLLIPKSERRQAIDEFCPDNYFLCKNSNWCCPNYNICTGSGSCINTPGIIGGVVVFIALVLISIGVRAARAKKLAAANLALTNQGVSMQPTNINRDATAPQSTNQASSGLVTLVK